MPSILIEYEHEVKTVSKQCQNGHILDTDMSPLQYQSELHQKDLRIMPISVHIWGTAWDPVSTGGHVSGLKSNRHVFMVQTVILTPTCRYFSHTAV